MGAHCRIELFGELQVEQGSRRTARFQTQKIATLLAYLAYHLGRAYPREVLIELLWPECVPSAGRNSLSVALSSLRQLLEPPGVAAGSVLRADRASVGLNPSVVTVDVVEFEKALRCAAASRNPADRADCLAVAVKLHQDGLLPGYYEDWIRLEQDKTAAKYFKALQQLIQHLEQVGDLKSAIDYAREGVGVDPLREDAHCELIRLYVAAGQPTDALQQYRQLEGILEREFEGTPSAETQACIRDLTGRVPPQSSEKEGGFVSLPPTPSPRRARDRRRALARSEAPTGTVTFCLADIETTPRELDDAKKVALKGALSRCHKKFCRLTQQTRGFVLEGAGHDFAAAFPSANDALAIAVAGQRFLAACDWPKAVTSVRLRVALHTDEVEAKREFPRGPRGQQVVRYEGAAMLFVARLLAVTHPGQILCSEAAASVLRRNLEPGFRLTDLGVYRLLEERGLEGRRDATTLERLFQVQHPEMATAEFPPPLAEPCYSSHLPLQATRFFGRKEELVRLRSLLESGHARLVTLTGPGGCGKTRLSIEVAEGLVEFLHGAVWFVPLAEISDGRLLTSAFVEALGLARVPDLDPFEQMVQHLSRQPALLVLDNFEQLVEMGASLVRTLLDRVPSLTCLVTSRRVLNLELEREYVVPPLPTPNGPDTPERLSLCESVQLFVDRAKAVRPDFHLTRTNAASVAELCDRLEGVPLALELAASRAVVASPAQMLKKLEHRFDLLVARKRGVAERHRTLRATIDWSYQLLAPELQEFFDRLSVFRGGCALEAAETVCNEPLALDYLAQLRECSLMTSSEVDEEMRYRQLETLREYGWERLVKRGESELMKNRHCRHFLRLAEEAEPALYGSAQIEWLNKLELELDNLRAAMQWAQDKGQLKYSIRLALALYHLLYRRGYWMEARQYLEAGWSSAEKLKKETSEPRAVIGHYLASLAYDTGDLDRARKQAEASMQLFRRIRNRKGVAESLNLFALIAISEGDQEGAQKHIEDALQMLEADDHARRGIVLHNLALLASCRGDAKEARELYGEALTHRRSAGNIHGEAETLSNLGALAHKAGNYAEARSRYLESLALVRSLGDRFAIAVELNNLGELAEVDTDLETAIALFVHAEKMFRELQSTHVQIPAGHLQRLAGEIDEETFAALRGKAEQSRWEDVMGEGLEFLPHCHGSSCCASLGAKPLPDGVRFGDCPVAE